MTEAVGPSPAAVPARATRAGETHEASLPHQEWSWVEPRIWTERLLAALAQGVKGGTSHAFFAEQGLFSLHDAHVLARQSSCRSTIDRRAVCGRTARTVVCPVKAGMFSRGQTCRGRSQSPRSLDSGGDGNGTFEAYRQDLPRGGYELPGRNNSERIVASKMSIPEGRARNRRAKAE